MNTHGCVPLVRPATAEDIGELLDLRVGVLASEEVTDAWRRTFGQDLRERLGVDPDLFVFVVPDPEAEERLLACAIGMAYRGYRGPDYPAGRWARVMTVATRPHARRRGYGRAVTLALVDALRAADCSSIELRATAQGEALYATLGFTRIPSGSYMVLRPGPDAPTAAEARP